MKKYKGLSVIGYSIVVVILIAIGMIISAPFIIEQNQPQNKNNEKHEYDNPELRDERISERTDEQRDYVRNEDYVSRNELNDLESRINHKIDSISMPANTTENITDKYICSIEGGVDADGNVVPINSNNPPSKIVFVCEYRR